MNTAAIDHRLEKLLRLTNCQLRRASPSQFDHLTSWSINGRPPEQVASPGTLLLGQADVEDWQRRFHAQRHDSALARKNEPVDTDLLVRRASFRFRHEPTAAVYYPTPLRQSATEIVLESSRKS